jgi:hypothetical protein
MERATPLHAMSSPIALTLLAETPVRASPYAGLKVRTGAWIVVPRTDRIPRDGLAFYNPQRLRGRLAKRLLHYGLWFTPTIHLNDDAVADLEAALGDCLGGIPIRCVFYFRSPGLFSKTIALALNEEGRAVAYVKLGSNVETNVTIAHEGHVLDRLAQVPEFRDRIPRVLARTVWRGFPALLLSVGPSKQLPRGFGRVHRAFLHELQHATIWRGELRDSAMWKTMVARFESIAPLKEQRWRDRYAWVLQQISERIGGAILPFSLAHRDFVPWNIHANDDGDLFVFDWELASDQCAPAWDFFHFHLAMRAIRAQRFSRSALTELVKLAEAEGAEAGDALLLAYLADVGLFLQERQARSPGAEPNKFLGLIEDAIDTLCADQSRPARSASGILTRNFGLPARPSALKPALNPIPANDD